MKNEVMPNISGMIMSKVLALTPEKPLFGHKSGKQSATHWIAFMKPNGGLNRRDGSVADGTSALKPLLGEDGGE